MILIIILSVNSSFAYKKLPKKSIPSFKQEISTFVNKILTDKICFDNTTIQEYLHSQDEIADKIIENFYKNKNNMATNKKYIDELNIINNSIYPLKNYILDRFFSITNKYSLEITGHWYEILDIKANLARYEIPQMEDVSKIVMLIDETIKRLDDQIEYINDYSIGYEQQKIDDFYKKNVKAKDISYLDDILAFNRQSLSTNKLYYSHAIVFQPLSNGVLASTFCDHQMGQLIFIRTNLSYKLQYNDMFMPDVILKYTGNTYNYRSVLGNYNSVPIFVIVSKKEFDQYTKIPEMGNFYFVEKPKWNYKWNDIRIMNRDNPYREFYLFNN